MSSDFINGLVATAEPVRQRRVSLEALALVAVAVIEVLGFSYFFDPQILAAAFEANPVRMAIKLILFGVIAVAAMGLAVLSLDPAAKRIGAGTIALVAVMLIVSVLSFDFGVGPSLVDTIVPSAGVFCVISVTSLALPVTLILGIFMTQGASTQPQRSAFLAGLAGGAFGAFIFSLQCPMVSIWYLGLWYGAGIVGMTVMARLLLPRLIRW